MPFHSYLFFKDRVKLLGDFPPDIKEPLLNLHKTLNGSSVEEFLEAVEPAFSAVGLLLRKPDKKKDRLVSNFGLLLSVA